MKGCIRIGVAVVVVVMTALAWAAPGRVSAQDVKWENISREITGGYCVQIDPTDPHAIYFGTSKGMYKTQDNGLNWKNILRDRDMTLNHVAFDPAVTNSIYAATSKGIYASADAGATWKNIYRGTNAYEADCRAVLAAGSSLYAGTGQGLIVSVDAGSHWNKESGALGKSAILAIAAEASDNGYVFAAALDGVYRKQISGSSWKKVFVAQTSENGNGSDDALNAADDTDQAPQASMVRYICVNANKAGEIYLATSNGVLTSKDSGSTWQNMTQSGLMSKNVLIVIMDEGSRLYAATSSDASIYDNGQWRGVSTGLTAKLIRGIACAADSVYAASDTGLYRLQKNIIPDIQATDKDDEYTKGLPSISSVQKAAIAYADVDMAKIREWRAQARRRAILPSMNLGINQDTTDLWHWEGGSTTNDYDDILRKGKQSYEWDVSLSWDLGELIWNNDQTSIDTRARLLVQLRDDILDEVTKLYFEYVRVRMELNAISILDKKKLNEKEIRLKELAAQMDGLTGNYFSTHKQKA